MYIIKKVHFDNNEYRNAEDAIYEESVGVIDGDEAAALRYMYDHQDDLGKRYKGYDGNIYPYYKKEFIPKLKIS